MQSVHTDFRTFLMIFMQHFAVLHARGGVSKMLQQKKRAPGTMSAALF